jgi:hypothetical protein
MLIEEGMTADDRQTREMYARYGLAMYFAQVVEASIKSALVMAELSSSKFATLDDFDDSWAENFTVTMGRLVRKLTPFLAGDTALGDDLQLALLMRNQLAHHFFWDHAADATTTEGRSRMITECVSAVAFYQDIEQRVEMVVRRYSESVGTTPEVFAARLEESRDELIADAALLGSKNCGRCHTPMEIVGSERRPYWKCPSCGSVALT